MKTHDDAEILRQKVNLEDSLLEEKGKKEFLTKTDDFHDAFFVRPYPMREEQKKVIQKEMNRLGII